MPLGAATLYVSSSGSGGGSAAPVALLGAFNTVIAGAVGSGRLADVTLAQLATLPAGGGLAYVISVKDFWRWDPLSTLADDTATTLSVCNPIANGANPGRFIRELLPAPEWMRQATWFIDGSNTSTTANDENDGLTAATALLTDLERERRMGPKPQWILREYHLRYVSDIAYVNLQGDLIGTTAGSCCVFAHGSGTDGQGQAVIFTGTIDALTAENPATNTPWQITSNAIPVSWTASGLIESATSNNRRIRTTSGAQAGQKMFAVFDQGAKQARWCETYNKSTYTAPYTIGTTSTALVAGLTYVVESLTQIRTFHCGLVGRSSQQAATNTNPGTFVAESLLLGGFGNFASGGTVGVCSIYGSCECTFDGCVLIGLNSPVRPGVGLITLTGSWITSTAVSATLGVPFAGNWKLTAGGSDLVLAWVGSESLSAFAAASHIRNNFMFQNGVLLVTKGVVQISSLCTFDPPATAQVGLQIGNTGMAVFVSAGSSLWGGGTVRAPINSMLFNGGGRVSYINTTGWTLLGTSVDINFNGRGTTLPAFDQATSVFTAPRTSSIANLIATVAAGGFGGTMMDPVTGSYIGIG